MNVYLLLLYRGKNMCDISFSAVIVSNLLCLNQGMP